MKTAPFDAWIKSMSQLRLYSSTSDEQVIGYMREAWEAAAEAERAACAAIVDKWSDGGHLKLHAGEMTAQELRTVQAVVNAIKADIRGAK